MDIAQWGKWWNIPNIGIQGRNKDEEPGNWYLLAFIWASGVRTLHFNRCLFCCNFRRLQMFHNQVKAVSIDSSRTGSSGTKKCRLSEEVSIGTDFKALTEQIFYSRCWVVATLANDSFCFGVSWFRGATRTRCFIRNHILGIEKRHCAHNSMHSFVAEEQKTLRWWSLLKHRPAHGTLIVQRKIQGRKMLVPSMPRAPGWRSVLRYRFKPGSWFCTLMLRWYQSWTYVLWSKIGLCIDIVFQGILT